MGDAHSLSLKNFHHLIWCILDSDAQDSTDDPKLIPVVYMPLRI